MSIKKYGTTVWSRVYSATVRRRVYFPILGSNIIVFKLPHPLMLIVTKQRLQTKFMEYLKVYIQFRQSRSSKQISCRCGMVLARLSKRIWTTTPRGTVNQELKFFGVDVQRLWLNPANIFFASTRVRADGSHYSGILIILIIFFFKLCDNLVNPMN